ncbi:MAG: glycosyltransferase family 4 protein [Deltaproteobacteria bacterium]|nr:glycosyltransferase family 4 protein [Deltaproteobacteria bacterium]
MENVETNGMPQAIKTLRILHLVKWLSPTEDTGGKIRSFRIGRALSSFAQVDAAGFVLNGKLPDGSEDHLSHYNRLYPLPICRGSRAVRKFLTAFAGGLSLRTARFFPGVFGPFVEHILRETRYDAIQVEELPLMSSVGALSPDLPVVFSSHNVESELSILLFSRPNPLFRLLANMECRRTIQEETKALVRARACLAVSERDRNALWLLSNGNGSSIHVLPNCAHDRFQPSDRKKPGKGLLFVGALGWYPNQDGFLWFMDEVLPLLRKQSPAVTVRVAGSGIVPTLRRKLERQGIDVHANVLDILPFMQEARLLFVPLRIGGGTRIKIVEAWAAGLPVVSTVRGAEGLPYRSGVDMLVADDAAGFATAVRRLLEDDGLHANIRSEGLQKARYFRWSSLASPLAEIYRNVLNDREA